MKTVSSLAVLTAGTVLLCLTTPHVAKAAPPADTYIRTDTELLTKGKVGPNGKNLDDFNLIVFASTTGELDLTDQQRKDILASVHDDGKGFVGIHAALDTNYKWPEYGEMIGAWFDNHPWGTFWEPIVNEDAASPITAHLPAGFVKRDEIYQPSKDFDRGQVHVLLRLRLGEVPGQIQLPERTLYAGNHGAPAVFAAGSFAREPGKPAAETAGAPECHTSWLHFHVVHPHTNEAWSDPDVYRMYFEAIKWALGLTESSLKSHARTAPPEE